MQNADIGRKLWIGNSVRLDVNAYGFGSLSVTVNVPSDPTVVFVPTVTSGNWYDLSVSLEHSDACPLSGLFARDFMGHMETGRTTTSDPAMATGSSPFPAPAEHKLVPESVRVVKRWTRATRCVSRRSRMKDACWNAEEEERMLNRMRRDEL